MREEPILTVRGVLAVVTTFLIFAGAVVLFSYIGQDYGGREFLPADISGSRDSSCEDDDADFNMRFVLLVNSEEQATSERIEFLNQTKTLFEDSFDRATDGLAKMNTSEEVVVLDISQIEGAFTSSGKLNFTDIAKAFYEIYPDNFDFLSFYTAFNPEAMVSSSTQFYRRAKSQIEGIGLNIFDSTESYGSEDGKLRGLLFLGLVDSYINNTEEELTRNTTQNALLHETGHEWCCYIGSNFGEGSSLEIKQQSIHYYVGLQSQDFIKSAMNAHSWESNESGGFSDRGVLNEEGNIGLFKYHPFTLYFMGVLPESRYDEQYDLYDAGEWGVPGGIDQENAVFYKKVSVDDIIEEEGIRQCFSQADDCSGSISGVVFHDENKNGVKDNEESGIRGAQVSLSGEANHETSSTYPGEFTFSNLCAGNYEITVNESNIKEELGVENLTGGTSQTLSLSSDSENKEAPGFGFYPREEEPVDCPSTLSIRVFWDENGNGSYDSTNGERAIDFNSSLGRELLELRKEIQEDGSGGSSSSVPIDYEGVDSAANGVGAVYEDLCPGDYNFKINKEELTDFIKGVVLDGEDREVVFSNENLEWDFNLQNSKEIELYFEVEEEVPTCQSKVIGFVWHDENKDGLKGNDEEGIADIEVSLETEGVEQVTTSLSSGEFIFSALCPGDYQVEFQNEDSNNELIETVLGTEFSNSSDFSNSFTLSENQEKSLQGFGFYPEIDEEDDNDGDQGDQDQDDSDDDDDDNQGDNNSNDDNDDEDNCEGSIQGYVWEDEDEDEDRDSDEDGIDDVTVRLRGDLEQDTETNSRGKYVFSNLCAGNYEVQVSESDAEEELDKDHVKRSTSDNYEVELEDDNDDEDGYDFGFFGWDTPDTGISAGGLAIIFALALILTLGAMIGIQKYRAKNSSSK